MKQDFFLVLLVCFIFYPNPVLSKVTGKKPLVWDMSVLQQMKKDYTTNSEVREIINKANHYCDISPIVVVADKKITFAPDNHYFCSIGPYWWPDTINIGKYVNRDGFVNPESKEYDNVKLTELIERCQTLSKAFYFTNDNKYYKAFIKQLQAWFINEDTYMYPNFEYSQVIPGKNNNKGRSTGFISAYGFNTIIESIRLVNGTKRIDKRTMKKIKNWFLTFAVWADEGEYSSSLHKANTNVGLAYDVTLVNIYLFVGKEKRAKELTDAFAEKRINVQIKEDGSQPAELCRTNAFSYSIYNLSHIVDFCFLVRYWYPHYYNNHRNRIDAAFAFLGQFIDSPHTFPYSQLKNWKSCKLNYNELLRRLDTL